MAVTTRILLSTDYTDLTNGFRTVGPRLSVAATARILLSTDYTDFTNGIRTVGPRLGVAATARPTQRF